MRGPSPHLDVRLGGCTDDHGRDDITLAQLRKREHERQGQSTGPTAVHTEGAGLVLLGAGRAAQPLLCCGKPD